MDTGTYTDTNIDAVLLDDGTMDTVVRILCLHCGEQWTERFSHEGAADYRESDGYLSDEGLAMLLDDPNLCCPHCEELGFNQERP